MSESVFKLLRALLADRWVLLILALAVATRLATWCFQVNAAGDDGERYFTEGYNLATYGIFSAWTPSADGVLQPTAHDLPLFPGIIALLLKIFPAKAVVVRLVGLLNILFYSGYVLNTMLCARLLYSRRAAILAAGVLSVVMPELLPYSLFYMPESLYLLLFSSATVLLIYSILGIPFTLADNLAIIAA